MAEETTEYGWLSEGRDRRRIPRYACIGQAQIACFPLSGTLLRGRVRDLGLGGCCIECIEGASPVGVGARTEILVEVNSWFFRAMAHVKAIRGGSGISMEFMRMSAGGYGRLADLIADLERPRFLAARPKRALEHSRGLLLSKPGSVPRKSTAIVGTIVPAEETSPAVNHHAWVRNLHPEATSVDIFA